MSSLAQRVIEPEFLDSAPEHDARQSLRDLARINQLTGGHRIARRLVSEVAAPGDRFSVLDVGCGSGDMGDVIRRSFPRAVVTSLDLDPVHAAMARPPRVIGNAFALPFAERSVDIVFCSLFLHHFEDDRIVALLRSFGAVARRAVLAIDLERGPLATRALTSTQWLFRWHPLTVHDGVISVRAGFKLDEFAALGRAAGLTKGVFRRHRPWARLSLSAALNR